jgi:hypothetical protein
LDRLTQEYLAADTDDKRRVVADKLAVYDVYARDTAQKKRAKDIKDTLQEKQRLVNQAVEDIQKISADEDRRIAETDALRMKYRQRRDAIDPNRNRFAEGSNRAVAVLLGALEGFIRPGQPSQTLAAVERMIEDDVQSQARAIAKEQTSIKDMDEDEAAIIARTKSLREREAAIRALRLGAVESALQQYASASTDPAKQQIALGMLAELSATKLKREREWASEQQKNKSAATNAAANWHSSRTGRLDFEFRKKQAEDKAELDKKTVAQVQAYTATGEIPKEGFTPDAYKLISERQASQATAEKTRLETATLIGKRQIEGIPTAQGDRTLTTINEDAQKIAHNAHTGATTLIPLMANYYKTLDQYNALERQFGPTEARRRLDVQFRNLTQEMNKMDTMLGGALPKQEMELLQGRMNNPSDILNSKEATAESLRLYVQGTVNKVKEQAPGRVDTLGYRQELIQRTGGLDPLFETTPPTEEEAPARLEQIKTTLQRATFNDPETNLATLQAIPQLYKEHPDWAADEELVTLEGVALANLKSDAQAEKTKKLLDEARSAAQRRGFELQRAEERRATERGPFLGGPRLGGAQ